MNQAPHFSLLFDHRNSKFALGYRCTLSPESSSIQTNLKLKKTFFLSFPLRLLNSDTSNLKLMQIPILKYLNQMRGYFFPFSCSRTKCFIFQQIDFSLTSKEKGKKNGAGILLAYQQPLIQILLLEIGYWECVLQYFAR